MATLKLCIVPAKVLINGKHKVRISLAHNSNTRYIPTNCIIDTLSQFKEGQPLSECYWQHIWCGCIFMFRAPRNHHKKERLHQCQVFLCNDILSVRTRRGEKKQIWKVVSFGMPIIHQVTRWFATFNDYASKHQAFWNGPWRQTALSYHH